MEQGKEGLCILIPIDTFYKIRLWEWNGVSNIQSAEVGVKFFSVRLKSLEIQFYFSIDEKNSTGIRIYHFWVILQNQIEKAFDFQV